MDDGGTWFAAVVSKYRPRAIVHLAALPGVVPSKSDPAATFVGNVEVTRVVAHAALAIQPAAAFVFASSSSVYGDAATACGGPVHEESRVAPLSPYAQAKALAEALLLQLSTRLHVKVLRLHNVYGPGGRADTLIPRVFAAALSGGSVVLRGGGLPRRDFTFVSDVVDALERATTVALSDPAPGFVVANIATGVSTSLHDTVTLAETVLRRRVAVVVDSTSAYDTALEPWATCGATDVALRALGWRAHVSLPDGLHMCAIALRRSSLAVAVVIATRNRPQMLQTRSLPAALRQTYPAALVVVVDDSDRALRPDVRRVVDGVRHGLGAGSCTRVEYVENSQCPGASGSWNTGIAWAYRRLCLRGSMPQGLVYVAILDDDDEWEADHLQRCVDCTAHTGASVIVSGIVRIDSSGRSSRPIPAALTREQFLVGNPNVQGSNLFVAMDAVLRAGLFDEALLSCTDRDLLLRLLDLPEFSWAAVSPHAWTVLHYADADRLRLSTPGSLTKSAGLDYFWFKHSRSMTADVARACLGRAQQYFGWAPSPDAAGIMCRQHEASTTAPLFTVPLLPLYGTERVQLLVVGIISDAASTRVAPLLVDLAAVMRAHSARLQLCVVVVANGAVGDALQSAVHSATASGLPVTLVTHHDQETLGMLLDPVFSEWSCAGAPTEPAGRRPIADMRTVLQLWLYAVSTGMQRAAGGCISSPVVWILDDDKRIPEDTIATLPRVLATLQTCGVDVVFGPERGAASVPALAVARTQLLDLLYALR
jgi:nucleoside-diphosphate-sugar epimerase/GT2 family glycosyltransferase